MYDAIVGLGNPGSKYEMTRHNAGFWFVDELARHFGGSFRSESRFKSQHCKVAIDGRAVHLLKPQTYMNKSGLAITSLAKYYKIPPERILVVHDELDLEPGIARLKKGGGHGGHNGLRDTISHIGKEFHRLRVGVGHPGHRDQVVHYVLNKASLADQQAIDQALGRSEDAVRVALEKGLEAAQMLLHTKA